MKNSCSSQRSRNPKTETQGRKQWSRFRNIRPDERPLCFNSSCLSLANPCRFHSDFRANRADAAGISGRRRWSQDGPTSGDGWERHSDFVSRHSHSCSAELRRIPDTTFRDLLPDYRNQVCIVACIRQPATMNSTEAEEPLICGDTPEGPDGDDGNSKSTSSSPTLFIYLLTFSAGISGLLFGCASSPSPFISHPNDQS